MSIYRIIIGVSLLIAMSAFNKSSQNIPFFPVKYPGKPNAIIDARKIVLSNDALLVEWELQQGVINLKKATNKYDNTTVDLRGIILFSIDLENGRRLTNHDFRIQDKPIIRDIDASDSLPTAALRFPGKEVSALLIEKSGNPRFRIKDKSKKGKH